MRILEPSLARLMLMTLTVAVGLAAMRTQSDVYLGALLAITVLWMLMALASLLVVRDRPRAFSAGFLAAAIAVIVTGFCPWSDAFFRGNVPLAATPFIAYLGKVGPLTRLFLRLSVEVKPDPRADLILLDNDLHEVGRVTLEMGFDRRGAHEEMARDLADSIQQGIRFSSTFENEYPRSCRLVEYSLKVYIDACYLLASLLFGEIAGWTALFLTRGGGTRKEL